LADIKSGPLRCGISSLALLGLGSGPAVTASQYWWLLHPRNRAAL